MKHIFAYKNDFVIYSGYINVEKIHEEKRGNLTYIHIYTKDEYVGVIACDKYEIN